MGKHYLQKWSNGIQWSFTKEYAYIWSKPAYVPGFYYDFIT